MINIIEFVHENGIVYWDIKPENFLFERKETPDAHNLLITFN